MGDVGQKLGYSSVDNGFLSFNNVRIPRENMLSRFAGVTKEGDLDIKADPRMIYQVMVMTRLAIMYGAAVSIIMACKMATRYAICRR